METRRHDVSGLVIVLTFVDLKFRMLVTAVYAYRIKRNLHKRY